jgi:hypothetical protein
MSAWHEHFHGHGRLADRADGSQRHYASASLHSPSSLFHSHGLTWPAAPANPAAGPRLVQLDCAVPAVASNIHAWEYRIRESLKISPSIMPSPTVLYSFTDNRPGTRRSS